MQRPLPAPLPPRLTRRGSQNGVQSQVFAGRSLAQPVLASAVTALAESVSGIEGVGCVCGDTLLMLFVVFLQNPFFGITWAPPGQSAPLGHAGAEGGCRRRAGGGVGEREKDEESEESGDEDKSERRSEEQRKAMRRR